MSYGGLKLAVSRLNMWSTHLCSGCPLIRVLEKKLKSFYLAIIGHMESVIPHSNVMHSALFNRFILSSVKPRTDQIEPHWE